MVRRLATFYEKSRKKQGLRAQAVGHGEPVFGRLDGHHVGEVTLLLWLRQLILHPFGCRQRKWADDLHAEIDDPAFWAKRFVPRGTTDLPGLLQTTCLEDEMATKAVSDAVGLASAHVTRRTQGGRAQGGR